MHFPNISALAFSSTVHDVLIIGGGTAGLTVATRLSEDPSLKIGVIEAGIFHDNDPEVFEPGFFGSNLGLSYDWNFTTTPQAHLNNRTLIINRGKMVGGSSSLNYMVWNRAGKADYDDWEELGNPGWGWEEILRYSKVAENIEGPVLKEQIEIVPKPPFEPEFHGMNGPVAVSFAKFYPQAAGSFLPTLANLGIPMNPEPMSGDNRGGYVTVLSIDQQIARRSDAATAYLLPNIFRKNLAVLTGAQATKVVFDQNKTATGVEFVSEGAAFTARARKEVVISAGTIQSPQLLEQSGIGNKALLEEAGTDYIVDNPGVGENLQDHLSTPVAFEFVPGIETYDLIGNSTFLAAAQAQYDANHTGLLTSTESHFGMIPVSAFMSPSEVEALGKLAVTSTLNSTSPIDDLLRKQVTNETIPQIELLFIPSKRTLPPPAPGKTYVTLLAGLVHPFSRGSIHINASAADPLAPPILAPNYYASPVDRNIILAATKFLNKIGTTSPLKEFLVERSDPPPGQNLTDAEWWAYAVEQTEEVKHPVGTCAMLPREKGGVVDPRLRVYGVNGLRVIDASIFPKEIAAHLEATVYAVAEKAAVLMKEDLSNNTR